MHRLSSFTHPRSKPTWLSFLFGGKQKEMTLFHKNVNRDELNQALKWQKHHEDIIKAVHANIPKSSASVKYHKDLKRWCRFCEYHETWIMSFCLFYRRYCKINETSFICHSLCPSKLWYFKLWVITVWFSNWRIRLLTSPWNGLTNSVFFLIMISILKQNV